MSTLPDALVTADESKGGTPSLDGNGEDKCGNDSGDAEGGDLHPELTDHLIGSDNVLSPHLKHDVIANVLDVNIKHFLEGRALTLIVPGLCLELLHARSDLTEGVHSAEDIGITDESSLKNVELEVA